MHILVDVTGQIIIDHVFHIGNVQSPGGNRGGDHNRRLPGAETLEMFLAFELFEIAMNRDHVIAIFLQIPSEIARTAFRLHEDERQRGRFCNCAIDEA